MSPLTARVHDGHLVLSIPTDLPEGTEIELVAEDGGDTLSARERTALHAEIGAALADLEAGKGIPLEEFLATFPSDDE